MNLTSKTTFSDLLHPSPIDCATTTETPETTQWSQKQLPYSAGDPSFAFQDWQYLAGGQVTGSPPIEIQNGHSPESPDCFCDHLGLSVDFSDLEALDLAALRLEMDAIAHNLGEAYRRLVLGFSNKVLWHWGDCVGAIARAENGLLVVDKAIARKMATAKTLLKCAMTDLRDYLDKWWDLNVSRTTLTRWVKGALDGLGIVNWFGTVAEGKKPRHWAINVPALLLLAEACERRIIGDAKMAGASHGEEMEVLPEHQGYSLKLLFDAIFPGFGWNREGEPEEPEPKTYAETDAYQAIKPQPVPRVKGEDAIAYVTEADEQRSALTQLRMAVKSSGWVDGVIQVCEILAARWGPSWGLEALYERVTGEASA